QEFVAAHRRWVDAALRLLGGTQAWQAASRAAVARVERYYSDTLMFDRYRQVYEGALARNPGAV
ncbi:MAG TPA: glycosyl transferase family 1, partial [Alicycliphilus sp.]|nr:glycosyl transferase family 1 [Alicycliphilus sp.]